MKTRILFVLMALMSLAIIAPAQQPAAKKGSAKKVVAQKAPGKTKKALPARDPKTGRFIKKTDVATTGATAKPKKSLPARDPKTGRFIKKSSPKKG